MTLSQLLADFVRLQHTILCEEDFIRSMDGMNTMSVLASKHRLEQNKIKAVAIGKVIDDFVRDLTKPSRPVRFKHAST